MGFDLAKRRMRTGLSDLPSSVILTRKELRDQFLSFRAYLMATVAFIGISFFMWIQTEIPMGTGPIVQMVVALLSLLGLFYAVAFSMDSIVTERTMRTMPLMRSAPVSASSIVLGKYAAVVLTWVAILVAGSLYFILGGAGLAGDVRWGNLLIGYLSTVLVVGAMSAVGIFISSFSSSVKSSALGSLGFLFAFMGLSVARGLFASVESVMDILNLLRNFSIIRYSGMITEQLFENGNEAIWGVLGMLAYILIFITAAVCVVGLKESDLP